MALLGSATDGLNLLTNSPARHRRERIRSGTHLPTHQRSTSPADRRLERITASAFASRTSAACLLLGGKQSHVLAFESAPAALELTKANALISLQAASPAPTFRSCHPQRPSSSV